MAYFYVQLNNAAELQNPFLLVGGLSDTTGEVHYALDVLRRFLQISGNSLPFHFADRVFADGSPSPCWVRHDDLMPYLRRLGTARARFLYEFFTTGRVCEVRGDRRSAVLAKMCLLGDEGMDYEAFLENFQRNYGPYDLKTCCERTVRMENFVHRPKRLL